MSSRAARRTQDTGAVLLLDKPTGPTSHDAVVRARVALAVRRVGHTGTLDPFASGLLVLCVGQATRLAEYFAALPKDYLATVRFGRRTDTGDPEGRVVSESDAWRGLDVERIEAALAGFRGSIQQVPSAYSAKKRGGERMYQRARRGQSVELAPVAVTIHELDLLDLDPPEVQLRVFCSSGTYIRALARDLGEALAVPAHLSALRRTRVGTLRVEDAVKWDGLANVARHRSAWLAPADALAHLPRQDVDLVAARRVAQGAWVESAPGLPEGQPVAVLHGGVLFAVAVREGVRLRPRKVLPGVLA